MENKDQDYDVPIDKTSAEIARMIISKFDELKDILIVDNFQKMDPIKQAEFSEKSTDFCIDVMNQIALTDIPFPYSTRGVDKIIQILQTLKSWIDGRVTQTRHEFASRTLGVKDPINGKYTEEQATLGHIMLKLEEVRNAQGNNKYDYFNAPIAEAAIEEAKKEEEDAQPSPYMGGLPEEGSSIKG